MRNGLILNSVVMGLGMHPGAWRYRDGDPFAYTDIGYYQEIARLSEVGRLHANGGRRRVGVGRRALAPTDVREGRTPPRRRRLPGRNSCVGVCVITLDCPYRHPTG